MTAAATGRCRAARRRAPFSVLRMVPPISVGPTTMIWFYRRADPPSSIIAEEALASARKTPQPCASRHANLYNESGVSEWLRSRFPASTGANVEADTGIPAATVDNWLQQRSRPSVENFATLIAVYGPALMAACLSKPAEWVNRAIRAERLVEIDEEIEQLKREREKLAR